MPRLRALLGKIRRFVRPPGNRFLDRAKGVIHVGANTGQERDVYSVRALPVLWIEPIPDVYERLVAHVAGVPEQRTLQALVADVDDRDVEFHVANNDGRSSSILPLGQHEDIWPDIHYVQSLALRTVTLPTLLQREGIDVSGYDTLVMDTQGSELLVLQGADPLLDGIRAIKTEAADFEVYEGCCQLEDLDAFLKPRGFRRRSLRMSAQRDQGGACYDALYVRRGR